MEIHASAARDREASPSVCAPGSHAVPDREAVFDSHGHPAPIKPPQSDTIMDNVATPNQGSLILSEHDGDDQRHQSLQLGIGSPTDGTASESSQTSDGDSGSVYQVELLTTECIDSMGQPSDEFDAGNSSAIGPTEVDAVPRHVLHHVGQEDPETEAREPTQSDENAATNYDMIDERAVRHRGGEQLIGASSLAFTIRA